MARPITPPIERFYRHVKRVNGCLIWTGSTAGSTDPRPTFRNTTNANDPKVYAHRWIYEQLVGPIPDGLEPDHSCRQTLCVEVTHMELVTHTENMRRARLTVCRAGKHDLTDPANMRWDDKGQRRGCRVCHRDKARDRYHRLKGGQ